MILVSEQLLPRREISMAWGGLFEVHPAAMPGRQGRVTAGLELRISQITSDASSGTCPIHALIPVSFPQRVPQLLSALAEGVELEVLFCTELLAVMGERLRVPLLVLLHLRPG